MYCSYWVIGAVEYIYIHVYHTGYIISQCVWTHTCMHTHRTCMSPWGFSGIIFSATTTTCESISKVLCIYIWTASTPAVLQPNPAVDTDEETASTTSASPAGTVWLSHSYRSSKTHWEDWSLTVQPSVWATQAPVSVSACVFLAITHTPCIGWHSGFLSPCSSRPPANSHHSLTIKGSSISERLRVSCSHFPKLFKCMNLLFCFLFRHQTPLPISASLSEFQLSPQLATRLLWAHHPSVYFRTI